MNKRHMRGFLDPISLGFVLAISGTLAALSLHSEPTQNEEVQVSLNSHQVVQTQVKEQN